MSNRLKIKEDKLLETVVSRLDYSMLKDILVKPLATPKVMKHIVEQVPTKDKDENGAIIYETKESDKEVDSAFRKGIVLKIPSNYDGEIKPGDTVVFPYKYSIDFDLFKDSMLVKAYDIIAIVTNEKEETTGDNTEQSMEEESVTAN